MLEPWENLRGLVDPEIWEELPEHFKTFRDSMDTEDPDLFIQYLYRAGKISKEHLGQALRIRGLPELSNPSALRLRRIEGDSATFVPRSPEQGYALLGKVGEGSMGRVFVAKDRDLHRKVAFKQISQEYVSDDRLRTRFLNEVQITAQLDHPNIVPVYALEAEPDGKLGYAMKLVEGRTLRQWIGERRDAWENLPNVEASTARAEALEMLIKVCDAIGYAHSRGVVHRDLKPDNIMVGAFGEAYVMDWGLARVMGQAEQGGAVESSQPHLTRIGDAVGTPAYMSPEQAQGRNRELDGRSDQYAIGLMLQEVLTLQQAVTGSGVREVMQRASAGFRVRPRHRYGAAVHPALCAVLDRACAPHPDDRYPSLDLLSRDLRAYLRGQPVSAYSEPVTRRVRRFLERHVVVLMTVLLAAVLIAGGSLMAGFAGYEVIRWREDASQDRRVKLVSAVSRQSHAIDVVLLGHQQLTERLAGSAGVALGSQPMEGATVALAGAIDEGEVPPDYAHSPRHGRAVSLSTPSVRLPPNTSSARMADHLGRLGHLAPVLRETYQRTQGEQGDARVLWMYFGTELGTQMSFPGHGGYPSSFDPRERPWYRTGKTHDSAVWGRPYRDVNSEEWVLPCSAPVHDEEGELLGVVGLDLTFRYLMEEWIEPRGIADAREAALLDEQGRVLLRTGQEPDERGTDLPVFEVSEVVKRVRSGQRSGWHQPRGQDGMWLYDGLGALGWTYVVFTEGRGE